MELWDICFQRYHFHNSGRKERRRGGYRSTPMRGKENDAELRAVLGGTCRSEIFVFQSVPVSSGEEQQVQ